MKHTNWRYANIRFFLTNSEITEKRLEAALLQLGVPEFVWSDFTPLAHGKQYIYFRALLSDQLITALKPGGEEVL